MPHPTPCHQPQPLPKRFSFGLTSLRLSLSLKPALLSSCACSGPAPASIIRYKVDRLIPSTSAARTLFPPHSCNTCSTCRSITSCSFAIPFAGNARAGASHVSPSAAKSPASITPPSLCTTAPRITFSNSRRFPGHRCPRSRSSAFSLSRSTPRPYCAANRLKKCPASSGISSTRSLSAGTTISSIATRL